MAKTIGSSKHDMSWASRKRLHRQTPSTTRKRPRVDDTESSAYARESDRKEAGLRVPPSGPKRTKLPVLLHVSGSVVESTSSDDEALVARCKRHATNTNHDPASSRLEQVAESSDDEPLALRARKSIGATRFNDGSSRTDLVRTPTPQGLTYSAQLNLTPAFKSIQNTAASLKSDIRVVSNQFVISNQTAASSTICSPPVESRLGEVFLTPQSRINSTPPSNRPVEIIDLTEDEPISSPATILPTPRKEPSLADRLFPRSPSPYSPSESPEHKQVREATFLKGLQARWWAGGLSMSSAIGEVNAGLPARTSVFTEKEGKRRLHSLSGQGRIAIRDELVYHANQDPGTHAFSPSPSTASSASRPSASRQLLMRFRTASTSSMKSPFGNISESRYRRFESNLYGLVYVSHVLFKNGKEEMLETCMAVLNESISEGERLSAKEVGAAFMYLANLGKVVIKDDKVKLIRLD